MATIQRSTPSERKNDKLGAQSVLITEQRDLGFGNGSDLPIFLSMDSKKNDYVASIFARPENQRMTVEGERPEIFPKHMLDAALAAAKNEEERQIGLRINERLVDQRTVVNIGPDLDQIIKNYSKIEDGLAILHGPGFAFMEHEHGSARDLKKALKSTVELKYKAGLNGHKEPIGALLKPYIAIPFEGSKLNYGTWGRPAFVDEDLRKTDYELELAIVKVHSIHRFMVRDKKESGFWTTDITEQVQDKIEKSGVIDGFAHVTPFHTTVGIVSMNEQNTAKLYADLLRVAPENPANYYHNKLKVKGVLKLRKDGKPLGDGNGQSHVHASLVWYSTTVPIMDGKLVLEKGERILHHDCDTLPPRERGVAVSLVENKESKVN